MIGSHRSLSRIDSGSRPVQSDMIGMRRYLRDRLQPHVIPAQAGIQEFPAHAGVHPDPGSSTE